MQASTGKYPSRYIIKKGHKKGSGKTIIKSQKKVKLEERRTNGFVQKNIFFSYGGYENIFLPAHHKPLF